MDFDRIKLMDIGISQYGIISTSQISFLQEIRELCEKNSCQNFATTWACPPAVGTLSECNEKCLTYSQALVINTIYPLEDSFDIEGMEAGHRMFKAVCDDLYTWVKPQLGDLSFYPMRVASDAKTVHIRIVHADFRKSFFPPSKGLAYWSQNWRSQHRSAISMAKIRLPILECCYINFGRWLTEGF